MADMKKITATIVSQEQLSEDIYSIWLSTGEVAALAKTGQFVNVYVNDKSKILPRPISLCEIDKENNRLRLVYRAGDHATGTRQLSSYVNQETIELMGPLGNGFSLEGEKPLLIGGGIGIPPMLQLAKEFYEKGIRPMTVLGYRTNDLYLFEEFKLYADVYASTDDGSFGTHGTVIDAIKENGLGMDVLYACGPTPMLRGVKQLGDEKHITAWISMEERMACGIGACLACVCKTTDVDHHSHVHNTRVCKEGPVFDAREVDLS